MVIAGLEGDQEPSLPGLAGAGPGWAGRPQEDVHMSDCLRAGAEVSACN